MVDLRRERRDVGFVALALAFIFLLSIGLQIFVTIGVSLLATWMFEHPFWSWGISAFPMYAVAMPLSLFFFRQCSRIERPMRCRLGVGNFWGVLCLCFVGIYLCNAVGTAANEAFSRMLGREAINEIEAVTLASPMWVNLIFTVLLAPIFEEIFFRKLLIDRLYPYGEIPAVLISGIAFGLVHGNFSQLFYAVAVGLIFGFVYTRTGNIRYSIAMHMILNLVGGVYAAEAQKLLEGASWGWIFSDIPGELLGMVMMIVYLGIMLLAVVGSIVMYTHYRRRILAPHLASVPLSSRDWSYVLLLNPSVWVFLTVCALMFVL